QKASPSGEAVALGRLMRGMLEPMNALDRLSRANAPHPSATLTPSPQGEGLSLTKTHLISLSC
ncbi:MAG: hypothetical protein ACI4RP_09815, partial [Acutalibacteraceae bacterium]